MIESITTAVMTILGKYVIDKGATLTKEVGQTAVQKAGEFFNIVLEYLRRDPEKKVIADRYEQDPQKAAPLLEEDLRQVTQADANFARQLETLLMQYKAAAQAHTTTNTQVIGGGAISQGGGDALGERAVKVGGNVSGSIITGDNNIVHSGRASTAPITLPPNLTPLRDKIRLTFSKGDLKALCFDLSIASDDLPGDTRTELAQSLVLYCHEHGRIPDLIRLCQKERPVIDWTL